MYSFLIQTGAQWGLGFQNQPIGVGKSAAANLSECHAHRTHLRGQQICFCASCEAVASIWLDIECVELVVIQRAAQLHKFTTVSHMIALLRLVQKINNNHVWQRKPLHMAIRMSHCMVSVAVMIHRVDNSSCSKKNIRLVSTSTSATKAL